MQIKKIKTSLNGLQIYKIFKEEPYSFFLDSGMDHEKLGQYSFIGFDPFLVLQSKGSHITLQSGGCVVASKGDPFDALRDVLADHVMDYRTELPFIGGAVGYLGYDMGRHLDNRSRQPQDDLKIADCHWGFYDGIVAMDHGSGQVSIAALGIKGKEDRVIAGIEARIVAAEERAKEEQAVPAGSFSALRADMTREAYGAAIAKIKEYIQAGDVYQVNFAQRFQCETDEDPFNIYARLREINPAPFAGMMDFGQGHILCSSPERFLRIRGRTLETRPIKGTCPRGKTLEEDRQNREALLASEKNRAELLMIVDLERNDLGKVSKPGTVRVTELFHPEAYPTVHHLAATVLGECCEGYDVVDCLKATFPGGSITGAPKIRAMEIIDELEPTSRNLYTGSMGYIGFNGEVDLNIIIRTILCTGKKAYFHAGGGIVWDSEAELEYEETMHKAEALMAVLKNR